MGDVAALTWPLTRPGGFPHMPNRVQRCLFGPVDHEKFKVQLEENMEKIMQQNKLRWNFDFENERPLPSGRYVWEKVNPPDKNPSPSSTADADSDGGSVSQVSEEKPAKQDEQTHITDFMRKRKSSNQKDAVTHRPKTRRRSST